MDCCGPEVRRRVRRVRLGLLAAALVLVAVAAALGSAGR